MFAQVINGIIIQIIQNGQPWTYAGVNYPSNWIQLAGPGDLAELGIVDVVYGERPNDTYYWVTQLAPVYNAETNQADVNFTSTPKDLATVQVTAVSTVNSSAYSTLLPSDWMIVRQVETGETIQLDWNSWRQSVRIVASNTANAINDSANVANVQLTMSTFTFPPSPDQPVGA